MSVSIPVQQDYQVLLANTVSANGSKQSIVMREAFPKAFNANGIVSNTYYYCTSLVLDNEVIIKIPSETKEAALNNANNWVSGVLHTNTFIYTAPE